MSYSVDTIPNFEREAKKLVRRYRSLTEELKELIEKLAEEPFMGTDLGDNIYKIRLAIKSKGKGKSGGARVITKVKVVNTTVYLLSIYSKGDKDDITDQEIQDLIEQIPDDE